MTWDGDRYQHRFDELAASGVHVHGEADFVAGLAPNCVLDAGCGSGRVGIELASRGIEVVGVDADRSMLATARRLAPDVTWIESDVSDLDLDRRFDVVVMAGNVPLFTPAGTQGALVAGCARHLKPGGALVAGFQLDRGYGIDRYDYDCATVGLALDQRWSTWSGDPYPGDGSYAVSLHRRSSTRPTSAP